MSSNVRRSSYTNPKSKHVHHRDKGKEKLFVTPREQRLMNRKPTLVDDDYHMIKNKGMF